MASTPHRGSGDAATSPYDALLLLSFGGPEGPDDVLPFLKNVTRGRGIPPERLAEVGRHYFQLGGVSPINAQNRELLTALRKDFAEHGLGLPVYWGNRNWAPYLADVAREMATAGVRRALMLTTSAYASYSSCRQYQEDVAGALAALAKAGLPAMRVDKLRHYFNHPGFVEPMIDSTLAALAKLPATVRDVAELTFTTHSIPTAAANTSGPPVAGHHPAKEGLRAAPAGPGRRGSYLAQHLDVAACIAGAVRQATGVDHPWRLVYQSRSGPPVVPWLEPDICDHLQQLSSSGVPAAVLIPIGFVSDHMEVVYDLDTEAAAKAADLGLTVVRAATVGADPRFVAAVRELVLERAAAERGEHVTRRALGKLGPSHDVCPPGCCPAARPGNNPRTPTKIERMP